MRHTEDLQRNLGNDFIWTKTGTCITTKWRKVGWIPASEDPVIQAKWARYQSLPTRSITDSAEHV